MSNHENLLRIHRWQLDERHRYAAALEALSGRLRADLGLLQAAIALEAGPLDLPSQSVANSRPASLMLVERHKKLEHSLAEIENQIVAARTAVAAAEHEIATYELAAAHRKPTARAVALRLTQDRSASPIADRRFGS